MSLKDKLFNFILFLHKYNCAEAEFIGRTAYDKAQDFLQHGVLSAQLQMAVQLASSGQKVTMVRTNQEA